MGKCGAFFLSDVSGGIYLLVNAEGYRLRVVPVGLSKIEAIHVIEMKA